MRVFGNPLFLLLPMVFLLHCEPGPERYYFRDAAGRIVLYHGVNVSNYSKYAPDFLPWQTKEDFARLRDWGFNAVRYLIFWEAIEPVEGSYDDAYLDATIERINWLADLGIDVLVDMHQDLFARQFTGDGFPAWAVNDCGFAFQAQQPWNLNYLEPAVVASFTNFWNSDALQAKYVTMMRHVLERIDGLPNVIGVDIMNEPFPGLVVGFEQTALSDFYNNVIKMRDDNHFRTRMFFEPLIVNSAGVPTSLGLKSYANCAYAPHYYDPLVHEGAPYNDRAKWWMDVVMKMHVNDMQRFKTPMLFGEFGIATNVDGYLNFLSDLLDRMDQYGVSWTYYTYDKSSQDAFGIVDENGNENGQLTRLVRLYPQRIAGNNPQYGYGDHSFDLTYDAIDTTAPTVIFIPVQLFGVTVSLNQAAVPYDGTSRYLEIQNQGAPGTKQYIHIAWQ